jgi:ABC-type Co2+ transport system permease subunit
MRENRPYATVLHAREGGRKGESRRISPETGQMEQTALRRAVPVALAIRSRMHISNAHGVVRQRKGYIMHIEPGVVDATKMGLAYATATGALGLTAKLAVDTIKVDGLAALAGRSLITTAAVFSFFQVLPHHPVGVSEVHLILGSTLFLLFGRAPAMIGLAAGLLLQGLFFAPTDLPQYGINVTTLLVPLYTMSLLAARIIPKGTAYKDISYMQALKLSTSFQAGIVSWVAFWALYGQGFGAENLAAVASFGAAYMSVILLEPLADLAILAAAKTLHRYKDSGLFTPRLFATA